LSPGSGTDTAMGREECQEEGEGQRRTQSSAGLNLSAPDTCGGARAYTPFS